MTPLLRIEEPWLQTFAQWWTWTFNTVSGDFWRALAGGYAAYAALNRRESLDSVMAAARKAALQPNVARIPLGGVEMAYLFGYLEAGHSADPRIKDIFGKSGVQWYRTLHALEDGIRQPSFDPSSMKRGSQALPEYVTTNGGLKPPPTWQQFRPRLHKRVTDLVQGRTLEAAARQQFDEAMSAYEKQNRTYQVELEQYNLQIDHWINEAKMGVPNAVGQHYQSVFDRWSPPGGIGRAVALVVNTEVVIGFTVLPPRLAVPDDGLYVPKELKESHRSRQEIYRNYLAEVALLAMHDATRHEPAVNVLTQVVVNVRTIDVDPSTGRQEELCLLSVAASPSDFRLLDLTALDPVACTNRLGARWSGYPSKFESVIPLLDEKPVTSRSAHVAALADMTPTEFEGFVTDMLGSFGYKATQTKRSRDGGIDCDAVDPRPLGAGRIAVQAKKYGVSNPVGVESVRELLGVVQHGGYSKGVLVTTSRFTAEAEKFADGWPIELINGTTLARIRDDIRTGRPTSGMNR